MFNKKGFTLAEMLIVFLVMGVILTLMLTSVKLFPDKNKALFKKAFQVVSRITYEMINDESLYPVNEENDGFDNTCQVMFLGDTFGSNESGNNTAKKQKFCNLFIRMVNTTSSIDPTKVCQSQTDLRNEVGIPSGNSSFTPSVTTADGIEFYLPITNFIDNSNPNDPKPKNANIYVDINNIAKPNCFYDKNKCKEPDRFTIILTPDGRIFTKGVKEREYLEDLSIKKVEN